MATTEELLFILRMQDQASSIMMGFSRTITQTGQAASAAKGNLTELTGAIGAVGVAFGALAAGNAAFKATLGTFREYELGMANVQKVSGIGGAAVKEFADKFDELARRMPISIHKLQEYGITAGQLGIQGTENILAITEAMAKLGTTTNVTGEKGTLAIAQLLQIMHEAPTQAARLATQLVNLDNVTAASGMTILNVSKEVGLSTSFFNIGSERALAIGAAIAGIGVRAERSGTAVGRVFTALDQATRGALPKGLKDLEMIFGQTAEQLRAMVVTDPTAVFIKFIEKLHQVKDAGGDYHLLLKNLGLGQRETASSILPLADHYADLARNLNRVATERKYQTAQEREFAIFLETLDSKVKMMANSWELFEKNLGKAVSGPAKSSVDVFTGAINALDAQFRELSPQQQQFIVSEGLFLSTVLGMAVAVRALVTAWSLLGVAALANPFTLALTAIGALGIAYYTLSGQIHEHVELNQSETTAMAMLASGTDDAARAMDNLTRAQAENIRLAIGQKIQDTKDKMKDMLDGLKTGYSGVAATVENIQEQILTLGRTSQYELQRLWDAYNTGRMSEDAYKESLRAIIAENPGLAAQAGNVLALLTRWDAAKGALAGYNDMLNRLDNHGEFPENRPAPVPAPTPPVRTAFQETAPHHRAAGSNNAQQIADFQRETQQKIEGFNRETAALNISIEAYQRQQKVERQNADVEGVYKRGLDLKIKDIDRLTAAYRQALEARDAGKDRADAAEVVKSVDEKIAAFAKEDAALRAGGAAYDEYKKAAKIEPEVEAFSKRLAALGMEADAVSALAQRYREAASAHAETAVQAEKDNIKQKESEQFAKSVGSAFTNAADAVLFQGASMKATANNFAAAIEKMIVQALLLKPIEMELSSFMNGFFTPGSESKNNTLGGGGALSGGLISAGLKALGMGGGETASSAAAMFDGAPGVVDGAGNLVGAASSAASSGGWLSSIGSWIGSFFHEGGVVGEATRTRAISSAVWAGAPRYHTGLGSDEFAAILQRGERVLTAKQNASAMDTMSSLVNRVQLTAQNNQPQANVVFHIQTPDADSFKASQGQIFAKASMAMSRAQRRG